MKREARVRELEARARAALEDNRLGDALEAFVALEDADPEEPRWSRHVAQLHRQVGTLDDELNALVRCADRHAARREFIPALATYKTVLCTDPGHLLAQERLAALQPGSGSVSVDYAGDPPAEPPPSEPLASAPGPAAPLDELVLTEVVAGAHPAHLADETLDGIHEIPLDPHGGHPEHAPRASSATRLSSEDVSQLEQTPLFSSLDGPALARLVEQVQLVDLPAGEELFHQGDPGGSLYVVAQGAVVPIAEGAARTRLAVLEAGEFFGEISLFTNQPRNATIEALVDSQLLCIDRAVMWQLVQEHSQVLSVLLQFLRDRLIQRLVRTSPLFRIFSSTKRGAIVNRFRLLEVADGHAVIEQHRPAEAVFILLSGRMEVVHQEESPDDGTAAEPEKVLATLEPGELFGEMSLLWREPSLASVVARGKCWLLALPSESFQEILDHHPDLAEMAAKIARERRAENKRTLRDALRHRDGEAGII